jgi:hypothetical protein
MSQPEKKNDGADEAVKLPYEEPVVVFVGNIRSMLAGGSGPAPDSGPILNALQ